MQGFGILAAALVAIIMLAIFKGAIAADVNNLDYVWRLCVGFGTIPCALAIYFRLTIPETPRYTMEVENNVRKAARDVELITNGKTIMPSSTENVEPTKKVSVRDFCRHFGQWRNFKVLLGTSMSWFALDVAFYGINLNSGIILDAIGYSGSLSKDPWDALFKNSMGNLIIALMGTVPGYWVTVALIEFLGRKKIQIIGFVFLTILYIILAAGFKYLQETSVVLFIVLFTLAQFFQNFGPNSTTFIIPGELFQTRFRSTAHGVSAAMGIFLTI
jgi:PHS family inorganic phosphate transporter-like MFS transporter